MWDKHAHLALRGSAHLLRRRILCDEFWILCFDCLEPLHKQIEIIIRDVGRILIVVLLRVFSDLFPQLCEFVFDFLDIAHMFLTASKSVHISARIS